MAPDECPDWTVVDVGSGCILIKRDGVWWYSDSEGGPGQDSVELWYEHGPWEIKALPVGYEQTPSVRSSDPWDEAEKHEFRRFDKGADYRHVCADCRHPRRHPIHGLEYGNDREPQRLAIHNDPPAVRSVKGCYGALMDTLDEYNEMVPEDDRVVLPLTLQEVISSYIEEREAIESIWRQQQEDNTREPGVD